ncbi:MUTL protein homolog 3 isoform X2 [Wolffia australiana]
MKGQKCLFLGLEENRQDVGTTVIVRDLFYNQPVRRKSMLASPKKVLLSLRKCILQAALVHPTVSFTLTDLESDSELFHTVGSSSPLSLVSSYLGVDISSSFHKVSYMGKNLKLNGFLSGPCGAGLMKAFQYLYINSRLVSRGPIHKLINTLASGAPYYFKILNEPEAPYVKRLRTQDCPAYLLNLCCPVSSYDLTFEPSKTGVEFKDWSCILSFIEQAVWFSWEQSPEQSFVGKFNEKRGISSIETEVETGGILRASIDLVEKAHCSLDKEKSLVGISAEAKYEIENLKTEVHDDDSLIDPFKTKRSKSRGDGGIPNNNNDTLWFSGGNFFGKSQEFPDQREQMELAKDEGETLFDDLTNRESKWSFPLLTRCGQGQHKHRKVPYSPRDFGEYMDKFSYGMENTRDEFRAGDVNSSRGFFSRDYLVDDDICSDISNATETNIRPCQGSRVCSLSDSDDDDLSWLIGQEDSEYFNTNFGKCWVSSSLGGDNDSKTGLTLDENSWRGLQLKSNYSSGIGDHRHAQVSETNTENYLNLDSSRVKNTKRRSHSAPPMYKLKSKIPVLPFHEFLSCNNQSIQRSDKEANFSVIASQPMTDETLDGMNTHGELTEGDDALDFLNANQIKWRRNESLQRASVLANNRDQVLSTNDPILDLSAGRLQMPGNSLIPESICRETLQDAKVLLQVDRKFIPATAGEVLIAIDQHAADERIRVEELRQKIMSGEGCSITYLDSEKELGLPEIGLQLVQNYADQIKRWGWICSFHVPHSGSFARNLSLLKKEKKCSITLTAVPCILGINLSEKDLLEYLEQLSETDGASSMPPSVLRLLNFKACRGAIMFGDPLLPSECSLIVEELKETSLCFQCAHGRPTTVPLVNLPELHRRLAKLRLQSGGQTATWHGLRHHKPDVDRARTRLTLAKKFQHG